MTFANEMNDFVNAFGAMSKILGTRESRLAERLDNEARRATIDYTKARTAELLYSPFDDFTYTGGAYPGTAGTPADSGGGGGPGAVDTDAVAGGYVPSIVEPVSVTPPPKPGAVAATGIPTPKSRPKTKTAAVTDDDVLLGGEGKDKLADKSSADEEALRAAGLWAADKNSTGGLARRASPAPPARRAMTGLDPNKLRTLDPRMQQGLIAMEQVARQMGVSLNLTAGTEGGHLSHKWRRDADVIGYVGGRKWNPYERAKILAAGKWQRMGLYPGMSAHVGMAVPGHTSSAMWGAGGLTSGPSSRQYRHPADVALYRAFSTGRQGSDFLSGSGGSDIQYGGTRAPTGGGSVVDWGAYIERAALARGIDPKIARRVAESEGLAVGTWQSNVVKNGRRETSYGPFQLLVGGGLGDEFAQKYGDPRDPGTVYQQIEFALDHAALNGWGSWYGADEVGIGNWDGLKGAKAIGVTGPRYEGGIEGYAGRGVGSDTLAGGTGDDEFTPSYPEARTKDEEIIPEDSEYSDARTKDDEIAQGYPDARTKDDAYSSGSIAEKHGVHIVQPGDTLWDIAQANNLDDYMKIVLANPGLIEDPDLIYPGQEFKIPGAGAVDEAGLEEARTKDDARVPDPRMRPVTPESYTPFEQEDAPAGLRPQPRPPEQNPMTSSTGDVLLPEVRPAGGPGATPPEESSTVYDNPPGEVRPAGGPGATPPEHYTPDYDDAESELQRTINLRAQYAANNELRPRVKRGILQALDVKIQQLSYEVGGTGDSTPTTVRSERDKRLQNANIKEFARNRAERQRGRPTITKTVGPQSAVDDASMQSIAAEYGDEQGLFTQLSYTPPTEEVDIPSPNARPAGLGAVPAPRPERGDITGAGAGDFATPTPGSGGEDTLGPAQQSIAEVSEFAGAGWNINERGHVVRPDGREAADDTFSEGRNAVKNGLDWLMGVHFPRTEGAVDDNVGDPNDPSDDVNAERYLSGRGAAKKSDMAKVRNAIMVWANNQGIELTDSELNMRALGAMFSFWTLQGEPEKARAVAGSMLQYHRILYGQYSAIAQAAAEAGDTDKAVEAAIAAYAQIPDGRDITVEGDATTGYTVSYINEETGKRLSKKVMSPQQMTGMIMGMSPDDVDKFLVKAAGEESVPEMSPQLESMLADLDDLDPNTRPLYDARGAAQLTSAQQQIYNNAHSEKLKIWDERTGGAGGRATEEDISNLPDLSAASTGTPAVSDTVAATGETAEAAGTEPVSGTGAAAEVLADEAGTYTGTKDHGFNRGTPLFPGSNIYEPGDDQTFGVGSERDVKEMVTSIMKMKTPQGTAAVQEIYKDAEEKRLAEINRRQNAYQVYIAKTRGRVPAGPDTTEVTPTSRQPRDETAERPVGAVDIFEPGTAPIASTSLYDVPGTLPLPEGGGPVGSDPARAAIERNVTPVIPPRLPAASRPEPDPNVLAIIGGNEKAEAIYTAELLPLQKAWDELNTTLNTEYEAGIALPTKRDWTTDDAATLNDTVEALPKKWEPVVGAKGVEHLERHIGTIRTVAQVVGQMNSLDAADAVSTIANMISVNSDRPTIPNFVAVAHPAHPTIAVVQPLNEFGQPEGVKLYIPRDMYEAIDQAWLQRSEAVVAEKQGAYPAKPADTGGGWGDTRLPVREKGGPADQRDIALESIDGTREVSRGRTGPTTVVPAVPDELVTVPPDRVRRRGF